MTDTSAAPVPALQGRRVRCFRGEDACFSNMHAAPVGWSDAVTPPRLWPCNELPYVLARTLCPAERAAGLAIFERFEAREPGAGGRAVKRWGRGISLRADWDAVKEAVMLALVRDKFGRNADLGAHLLATGDGLIEEGNDWGDLFWGVALHANRKRGFAASQGENRLGRTLMRVREELRRGERHLTPVIWPDHREDQV